MSRIKIQKKPTMVVSTREEFEEAINSIARLDVHRARLAADMAAAIQAIQDKCGGELKSIQSEIQTLLEAVEPWFIEHAADVCVKGQRQGETKLATFGVRTGMPKVVKTVKTAFKALATLWHEGGNDTFVKADYDVDKDALIRMWRDDREEFNKVVPSGIKITQEDDLWVKPKTDEIAKI